VRPDTAIGARGVTDPHCVIGAIYKKVDEIFHVPPWREMSKLRAVLCFVLRAISQNTSSRLHPVPIQNAADLERRHPEHVAVQQHPDVVDRGLVGSGVNLCWRLQCVMLAPW
jgi:hypothetical protein